MSGFLATFQVPEQQILDQEQGPDPGLSHQTTFVIWRDEKGVKLFSFFKYDVLSAGVVESQEK